MYPDGIVWRRVRMDFKDLSVATPQEELAEKCAELMDGLRCHHLLLFYHNYIPVSLYPKDFSLWNSQPVQTKSCLPAAALTHKPSPPKYIHYIYYFLKFVFLSCGIGSKKNFSCASKVSKCLITCWTGASTDSERNAWRRGSKELPSTMASTLSKSTRRWWKLDKDINVGCSRKGEKLKKIEIVWV